MKRYLDNTLLYSQRAHWVLAGRINIMMQEEAKRLRQLFGKE